MNPFFCTRALACLVLAAAWSTAARCEQFLSLTDAQSLCFPAADRFEPFVVEISKAQAKAIAQQSGVKGIRTTPRVWMARQGDQFLGLLLVDQVRGKHNLIDYLVALSPEGAVRQVEILEYREKYGGQVALPDWRRQFQGKTARDKIKLNEDINNVTGATISCRNVTDGVRHLLATYEVVLRPGLLAQGQPPHLGTDTGP